MTWLKKEKKNVKIQKKKKPAWKGVFGIFVMLLLVPNALAFDVGEIIGTQGKTVESCAIPEGVNEILTDEELQRKCYPVPTPVVDPQYSGPKIDVVFVIDSTGSMADEIRSVKMHLVNLINDVRNGQPSPDLMIGVVTYRDFPPEEYEYSYKSHAMTHNVDAALNYIRGITAAGGGDHPEAVADGLHEAINGMSWRQDARRLVFLIGDAAPHGEGSRDESFHQGTPLGRNYHQNIKDAIANNIKIYTISGSGIDSVGVHIWKEIAYETGGKYEHLDYYRTDVEQYAQANDLPDFAVQEIEKSSDYDSKSKSFLANTLDVFTNEVMKAEAMEMGVEYDERDANEDEVVVYDSRDEESDITAHITADDIIGNDDIDIATDEDFGEYDVASGKEENKIYSFFKSIFSKLVFWH